MAFRWHYTCARSSARHGSRSLTCPRVRMPLLTSLRTCWHATLCGHTRAIQSGIRGWAWSCRGGLRTGGRAPAGVRADRPTPDERESLTVASNQACDISAQYSSSLDIM